MKSNRNHLEIQKKHSSKRVEFWSIVYAIEERHQLIRFVIFTTPIGHERIFDLCPVQMLQLNGTYIVYPC